MIDKPVQDISGEKPPRSRKTTRAPARVQLTPTDWINAATELLVRRSIDAINVDTLAKNLGVTRGSFYWHFIDREDLLLRMLDSWRNAATEQVITRFEREGVTPRELISELLDLPFRGKAAGRASSIELAIRAWARRDDVARKAVDMVDTQRLSYIAQCFTALDFDIAEARARSFMLYAYELAESFLAGQSVEIMRTERRQMIENLLMRRD